MFFKKSIFFIFLITFSCYSMKTYETKTNFEIEIKGLKNIPSMIIPGELKIQFGNPKNNKKTFWQNLTYGLGIGCSSGIALKLLLQKYTHVDQKYAYTLIGTASLVGMFGGYLNWKLKQN